LVQSKQYARNAPAGQITANFPQPETERRAGRFTGGPPEFHGRDIVADDATILTGQFTDKIPYRLGACLGAVENRPHFF